MAKRKYKMNSRKFEKRSDISRGKYYKGQNSRLKKGRKRQKEWWQY